MVCTRDIPLRAESGRERTMAFIRSALQSQGRVEFVRMVSLLERPSLRRALSTVVAWLEGLLSGRTVPLQALLFHDHRFTQQLLDVVAELKPSTVYFDGVRSGLLAMEVRRRFPALRLVCDFDDLMSRRMHLLKSARQPISMGYLKKFVPPWVQRHVLDGLIGRAVQAYEEKALRGAEQRICAVCDRVVLVSAVDAGHLREDLPQAPVEVIPPVMPPVQRGMADGRVGRFVFIGSDSLLQNRQSIEFLVSLWQRVRPSLPLHVFGKQTRDYGTVPGVQFRGFVAEVAAAYEPGSVLLAPSFLSGGVKTKVLEAMAYGVVPVGTAITFEGIDAPMQALVCAPSEWDSLVSQPEAWQERLHSAGRLAIEHAVRAHSPERLGERWCQVVWPA